MIKFYNTASRKLESFKPLSEVVKIYTCGPTVYSEAHIGNLTAYIYWDLLVRTLRMNDFKVRRVLNLTDVGHLVSDADEGEDKLEKGAKKEGKTVWEIAEKYIEKFKNDYRALNLTEPEVWARATDYIEEDKEAVSKMTEAGFTYETSDGVYFDTSKFSGYADFAQLDLSGLKAGARVSFSGEKRNASDFVIWKFIQPGENHEMRWDYLGRPGYPGWHLECSTIINKELGEPIDIHTGGIDHIPIHHTNEIAQTFAISGLELSRYWLHCDFITIEGEKISKSIGNVYSLDDLSSRGFSAMDFKMWVLSGHYRGTRNFTFESLEAAKQRRLNWRNRIALLYQGVSAGPATAASPTVLGSRLRAAGDPPATSPADVILGAVNNDLNSPEAFAIIDTHALTMTDWEKVDELFGLNLIKDSPDIGDDVRKLIAEREKARAEKNWSESDRIRVVLNKRGIAVHDTPNGTVWGYI